LRPSITTGCLSSALIASKSGFLNRPGKRR
jgi:hypothetical protein